MKKIYSVEYNEDPDDMFEEYDRFIVISESKEAAKRMVKPRIDEHKWPFLQVTKIVPYKEEAGIIMEDHYYFGMQ